MLFVLGAQKFRQILSFDPDVVLNGYRLQEQKCPVLKAIIGDCKAQILVSWMMHQMLFSPLVAEPYWEAGA